MPKRIASADPWPDQFRAAIQNSGLSVYRIAQETGVPKSTIHSFLESDAPQGGLSLRAAEKIARYLGFELFPPAEK